MHLNCKAPGGWIQSITLQRNNTGAKTHTQLSRRNSSLISLGRDILLLKMHMTFVCEAILKQLHYFAFLTVYRFMRCSMFKNKHGKLFPSNMSMALYKWAVLDCAVLSVNLVTSQDNPYFQIAFGIGFYQFLETQSSFLTIGYMYSLCHQTEPCACIYKCSVNV